MCGSNENDARSLDAGNPMKIRIDAYEELLVYAKGFVTPRIISELAPRDPGYWDYVREWHQILASRSFPLNVNFDIAEVVGMTRWADAERDSNPRRFRRFRVFTNSVALGMTVSDPEADGYFPPNYTLISLIDDANVLQDADLWRLLLSVFEEAHEVWHRQQSEESAFGLLALLLLKARRGASEIVLQELAERLMEEEGRCQYRISGSFLFGCTYFNQLNHLWRRHVLDWIQPTSGSLALVRDALLDQ